MAGEGKTGGRDGEHDQLDAWRSELLRYVHRLTGDADLAEDVAQESLLRFVVARASLPPTQPRSWLYRVATNLLRDHVRREAMMRRQTLPEPPAPSVPDREYERQEAIRSVRAVLDQLSPRDRQLLILRESGFRHSEIAEVINVKPESVSMLMLRAMQRFRAAWQMEGSRGTPR